MSADSKADYMNYELYQGLSGTVCWGSISGTRRQSSEADILPGTGLSNVGTPQGFIYRTVILPGQADKPAGTYRDTIIVDIAL